MRFLSHALMITMLANLIFASPSEAAAKSPDPRAVSMYNLGLNSFKQGSTEAAIIFFKRAADLDGNLADAHYNLGVLYQSQRRYKEAVPRFEQVLRIKPNDPEAHLNLGKALMALGKTQEAKSNLQSIAPSSSHFAEAQKLVRKCDANPGQATAPTTTLQKPISTPPQTQPPQRPAYTPPVQTQTKPVQNTTSQTTSTFRPQQQTSSPYRPANTVAMAQTTGQKPASTTSSAYTSAPKPVYRAPVAGQPTAVLANTSVKLIATGFASPSGLTFDRLGNLYVANYSKNSVDRISRDGTKSEFSKGGHLKGPIGLAADDAGNIYVANYLGGTVARITPAGISTIIATGFKRPYYLILDKGNNLFVSQQEDNSIIRISLPK